jgi:hypothetical protein
MEAAAEAEGIEAAVAVAVAVVVVVVVAEVEEEEVAVVDADRLLVDTEEAELFTEKVTEDTVETKAECTAGIWAAIESFAASYGPAFLSTTTARIDFIRCAGFGVDMVFILHLDCGSTHSSGRSMICR